MDPSKNVTRILLGLVILVMAVFDYQEYDRAYEAYHGTWMDVISGTAGAPQQYRIAVPLAANSLRIHFHIPLRAGFTLIDAICAAIGLYTLLALFHRGRAYRETTDPWRWFGNALFLLLARFYFGWITWYQRPETMASTVTLALSFWLLTLPTHLPKTALRILAVGGMLVLAAIQACVRADVLFAFHVGVAIACLLPRGMYSLTLPRYAQLAVSIASAGTCVLIQYYLMHFVYPHAQFGKVVVIRENLTQPLGWVPFCLFIAPWGFLMAYVLRRRPRLDIPNTALLLGSAIYVAMWATVGRIEEVRIFMPYAITLIPLTSTLALLAIPSPNRAVVSSVQ